MARRTEWEYGVGGDTSKEDTWRSNEELGDGEYDAVRLPHALEF